MNLFIRLNYKPTQKELKANSGYRMKSLICRAIRRMIFERLMEYHDNKLPFFNISDVMIVTTHGKYAVMHR